MERLGVEQSLHLKFKMSNNQAEYKTLIIVFMLAKDMEWSKYIAKVTHSEPH